MQALAGLNHYINKVPETIEKQRYSEYFGMFWSAISGIAINILSITVFLSAGANELALYCVMGLLYWGVSIYFLRKGDFHISLYVGVVGMTAHIAIISWLMGTDYGAQMILWTTISMTTLHNSKYAWLSKVIGLLIIVELICIYAFFPAQTELQVFPGNEHVFFSFVVFMSFSTLMFVTLRLKVRQVQQQKKLKHQVYNDELTGLYNRHFVYELLDYELEMMEKLRSPFCLCFADVDHFKKINDTHGHQVGDEVLIEIAQAFTSSFRKSDVVSRWGGEEFVVVFPRCDLPHAKGVIEKFKQHLAAQKLSSKNLEVTMSYGIVNLHNKEPIEKIIKRADDLLYQAKRNGRNRIEIEN